MPKTKSAKKALRKSLKRKVRNLMYKKRIKTLIKEIKTLILEKKIDQAKELLPQIYKALDKAAKVGVIKKNTASRKKSKIALFLVKAERSTNPEQAQG